MSQKLKSLLPSEKTKEIIDWLVKNYGYVETKKNGSSHRIFKSTKGFQVLSIPNEKILSDGVKRQVCKAVYGESYYNGSAVLVG